MQMLTRVGAALQTLFQNCAQEAAEVSQVIQSKRKFDAVSLAKTFGLGFWQNPTANEVPALRSIHPTKRPSKA